MKNLLTILLILNILLTIALGFMFHQTREETKVLMLKIAMTSDQPNYLLHSELEILKTGNKEAFNMMLSNQQFLNLALLRIHHFVEPHSDKFYKNCPDCQEERGEIEEGTITLTLSEDG